MTREGFDQDLDTAFWDMMYTPAIEAAEVKGILEFVITTPLPEDLEQAYRARALEVMETEHNMTPQVASYLLCLQEDTMRQQLGLVA